MTPRLTTALATEALTNAGPDATSIELFRHGSGILKFYRPDAVDRQQPHAQDEFYVVVSGSGWFVNGATREPFRAGDVMFVAAGVEHRFEDFSADFATWVLFYGPPGGEDGGPA